MPDSEQEQFFRYGGLQSYVAGCGLVVLAGAGIFLLIGLFDRSIGYTPAYLFGSLGLGLVIIALTPMLNVQFRINPNGIGRIRSGVEVFIPWSELDSASFRGTQKLVLQSAKSTIALDKQVDDYLKLYAAIRKFAPPHVWKQWSFPVRVRALLVIPVILWSLSGGLYIFMKLMTDYSPPRDATVRLIVTGITYSGLPFALLGIWLALKRCEFTATHIRVGTWPTRKTYEVAKITEMYLGSVEMGEEVRKTDNPNMYAQPYGSFQNLEFRFQDGRQLTISNQDFFINVEALFDFLSRHYPGAKTQPQESA